MKRKKRSVEPYAPSAVFTSLPKRGKKKKVVDALGMKAVRALAAAKSAAEAQAEADANKPPPFSEKAERLEWERLDGIAKGSRKQEIRRCNAAAGALLAAAGFKSAFFRKKR